MNRTCSVALEGDSGVLKVEHAAGSIKLHVNKSQRFVNVCPLCGTKSRNWFAYETNLFVDQQDLFVDKSAEVEKKK